VQVGAVTAVSEVSATPLVKPYRHHQRPPPGHSNHSQHAAGRRECYKPPWTSCF